ncbi:hypothetical protein K432DRAFT_401873 [Lepidopterella palustris CBS 459.81]|uniref:ATPase AAA-type core domain-containing protein n=1 Tax=Lepidopterella palustris CBS 459.81 TaxID=1314670 RepID=A0A8E2JIF2_9PEZI|nr:hypothetical protein K432DRAFT_401873 [Lepidopterella palustris CBS 459.81]
MFVVFMCLVARFSFPLVQSLIIPIVLALASHLEVDVCQIHLTCLNNKYLLKLLITLLPQGVVVIENVYSAGIDRQKKGASSSVGVTFSSNPNTIDGNTSQEGRLLVMTSNYPLELDDTLVCPGQIDKQTYFGNMPQESAGRSFIRLIGKPANAKGNIHQDELEPLAKKFGQKFLEGKFAPVELQWYLQTRREDLEQVFGKVEEYFESGKILQRLIYIL